MQGWLHSVFCVGAERKYCVWEWDCGKVVLSARHTSGVQNFVRIFWSVFDCFEFSWRVTRMREVSLALHFYCIWFRTSADLVSIARDGKMPVCLCVFRSQWSNVRESWALRFCIALQRCCDCMVFFVFIIMRMVPHHEFPAYYFAIL